MKLTIYIVILIFEAGYSQSIAEEKIKMLLQHDGKKDIEIRIHQFETQQTLKRHCKDELNSRSIPFSCYRLTNLEMQGLNKICAEAAPTLQLESLSKVEWVSSECQRALAPYVEKLNYIKSAENPSAFYFNE